MDIFLQQIVNGLVQGSIYALVALGYTMVYGIMRESRRIGNRRLKNELKLKLAYPTVIEGIASARRNACQPLRITVFLKSWYHCHICAA